MENLARKMSLIKENKDERGNSFGQNGLFTGYKEQLARTWKRR